MAAGGAEADPDEALSWVLARLADQAVSGWLVGGAVRDRLLGRRIVDVDVVVAGGAVALAGDIAAASAGTRVILDAERDVARVVWSGRTACELDIAALCAPTIAADLAQRDFTINAVALPLGAALPGHTADLIDPRGGLADLRAGLVRMTAPSALAADPLRTLRAVRLAAELGFRVEDATCTAIRAHAGALAHTAGERVREELLRTLAAPACALSVRQLWQLDLLAVILPELAATAGVTQSAPHDRDVLDHTLAVLAAVEAWQERLAPDPPAALSPAAYEDLAQGFAADLRPWFADRDLGDRPRWVWLRLAALIHDIGKPATRVVDPLTGRIRFHQHDQVGADLARQVAERLRLSRREVDYLRTVVAQHLRPFALTSSGPPSRRSLYRYYRATDAAGVDVALLALADAAGKGVVEAAEAERLADVAGALWRAWFHSPAVVVRPPPLIRGQALMASLGLDSGPSVGRLLRAIEEAQAAGEVATVAEALALARRLQAESPARPLDSGGGPE